MKNSEMLAIVCSVARRLCGTARASLVCIVKYMLDTLECKVIVIWAFSEIVQATACGMNSSFFFAIATRGIL